MIKGVGIDTLEFKRVQQVYDRHTERFVSRILTKTEQEEIARRKDPVNYLAKQFAAKEAIAKAFGTGIGELSFLDIEVLRSEKGQPTAKILPSAHQQFQEGKLHVSLTDTRHTVTAMAVLEIG